MKVIISHDVDHLKINEHKRDLIIPKFVIRSSIEFLLGSISKREYLLRLGDIINNKWQNLDEIMEFNKINNIPATFFLGVANGLGLSYPLKDAAYWIKRIIKNDFDIGVHGIHFENKANIEKEFHDFKAISELRSFGIRMHYLRTNDQTLNMLGETGYLYDTSIYSTEDYYKIGNLWEFPLHIMDGHLIKGREKFQRAFLDEIKKRTERIVNLRLRDNQRYLTILFHDRYFSESFKTWKEWYLWLIDFLKEKGLTFINYRDAICEIGGEMDIK